jgi:hypothetical protein
MASFGSLYQCIHSASAAALNEALLSGYLALLNAPETRSSHYFSGRYENVYISAGQLPAYAELLSIARELATGILGAQSGSLKVGGWFNGMGPGQATVMHSHDDSDEVLSGVYYVAVPAGSGELILMDKHCPVTISPEVGSFVFFSPALQHEVTANCGNGLRLSIGMNFGYVTT